MTGSERTDALTELARVQLELERLALQTWNNDSDRHRVLAEAFTHAEHVDRIARLWPTDGPGHHTIATGRRRPGTFHSSTKQVAQ